MEIVFLAKTFSTTLKHVARAVVPPQYALRALTAQCINGVCSLSCNRLFDLSNGVCVSCYVLHTCGPNTVYV